MIFLNWEPSIFVNDVLIPLFCICGGFTISSSCWISVDVVSSCCDCFHISSICTRNRCYPNTNFCRIAQYVVSVSAFAAINLLLSCFVRRLNLISYFHGFSNARTNLTTGLFSVEGNEVRRRNKSCDASNKWLCVSGIHSSEKCYRLSIIVFH